jgi:hypothetical protein
MTSREWHIHLARVYLAQAANARRYPQHAWWHATLLRWVADQRRRAAGVPLLTAARGQGVLFEDSK